MKQKILIKVQMRCGKCRKEAMKIAATSDGVISVALQGSDKDQIVVIGNEVDSAGICTALRKKIGGATLLSVEEVKDPKPEDKKKEEEKKKSEEKKEEKKAEERKPTEEKKKENEGQPEKKKEQSEESSKKSEATAAGVSHHPCPGMYYHPPPQYHYQNPQCYMAVPVPPDDNPGCNIM